MFKSEMKIGYALALFDIAKEEKKTNKIYLESIEILDSIVDQPDFQQILDSSISSEKKEKIINEVFSQIHWSLLNVIKILSYKNKFKFFEDILKKLIKYLQEELKIEEGIIYSTYSLSSAKMKKLEQKLSKDLEKKIYLKNLLDSELIGGFKIVIGSLVIESSIISELESMKHELMKDKRGA